MLDSISFSIRLDVGLGICPADEIEKIRTMLAAGDEQKLIINGRSLGDFVLENLEESWTRLDHKGRLITAALTLSLKEFAHGN